MRPTRSKEKLKYHKKLLAVEKRINELFDIQRHSEIFIEIPPVHIGYKVKLVPIDSLRNHEAGLAEAVEASTSWFCFSEKPFRFCNLKRYCCMYKSRLRFIGFSEEEKIQKDHFQNKIFKKGQLKLLDISEKKFQMLSPQAQKYFTQGFDGYDNRHNAVYLYHPDIPKTYVRECEEKLFWNRYFIPDSVSESEEKHLSNWLDYKKECELSHYKGDSTAYNCRWERRVYNKKIRAKYKHDLLAVKRDFLNYQFNDFSYI